MTHLTLYLGDSNVDGSIRQMLESWLKDQSGVTLEYRSIHADPTSVVRLGITELPALVLQEEIIAQGDFTNQLLPVLDRVLTNHTND